MSNNLLRELIAYFESDGGPLYRMWEDAEIGIFDDCEWDWPQTLDALRDVSMEPSEIGSAPDVMVTELYRKLRGEYGQ